jgi:pimeloyl-ACP methyl ester carboxylesterase
MEPRIRQLTRIPLLLIAAEAALAQSAGAPVGLDCANVRGRIVGSELIGSASRDQIIEFLDAIGWPTAGVKSGVTMRRLVYTTVDAHGSLTVGSGLLALPADTAPIGVVWFGHGTSAARSGQSVPATPEFGQGTGVAALFAGGGFALVAPDYVGLGLSPGPHPYLHRASEATVSIDLLMAVRQAAREARVSLPESLYLTGFSQGGQAALALDHAIETDQSSPWRVAALAPIAGPYALSGVEFPGLVDGSGPTNSAYLAYLAISYIRIYGTESASDVFTPPHDTQLPPLFNGEHTLEQVAQMLPPPRTLFRQEFLAAVSGGTHPFAPQLRANDTLDVRPRAPVRLYYGEADIDVFPSNTQAAATAMKAAGAKVEAVDLGSTTPQPSISACPLCAPGSTNWLCKGSSKGYCRSRSWSYD